MAVVIVSAAMFVESAPASCPADRPVDDIIAEVHKEQSNKKHRNSGPFAQVTCSWGWCIDHSTTPPTIPEPAPRVEVPSSKGTSSSTPGTDTIPVETCAAAMKMALEAAHNVEVGDYSFGQKNYNGALQRYNDALEEKPEDIAIYVRLGRALEKLDEIPQAIEQYKAAQKLAGPEKWSDEARSALLRLQHAPGS
jgi:tetratricopeptide (TPR) repeat protein